MGWEWRVFLPLTAETSPKPDIALLLGRSVEVETVDELHFVVGASIDLRRVRLLDGRVAMRLRVLVGADWSAGAECWVLKPVILLSATDADADTLCIKCRRWLLCCADDCEPGVAHLLLRLANGEARPEFVRVHRRQLRAALPSEKGVLLEQSDLRADQRLWRSVSVEGTSPRVCHRTVLELRERFAADGLVQSMPLFAKMLLRTQPAAIRPALASAAGAEGQRKDRYVLGDLLTERWLGSNERFSQRVWRQVTHDAEAYYDAPYRTATTSLSMCCPTRYHPVPYDSIVMPSCTIPYTVLMVKTYRPLRSLGPIPAELRRPLMAGPGLGNAFG